MSKAIRYIGRKCIACSKTDDRKNLIRALVDHKSGDLIINPGAKEFGRSFYVCKSRQCFDRLKKHKKYKDRLDFMQLEVLIQN